jgi:hypothetical protein
MPRQISVTLPPRPHRRRPRGFIVTEFARFFMLPG